MSDTQVNANRQVNHSITKPRIPSFILASTTMGVILTAFFYLVVVKFLCRGTYVEVIFTQRGIIPYITSYLAFVALAQLLGLAFYLWKESKNLVVVSGILSAARIIDTESADSIMEEIVNSMSPEACTRVIVSRTCRVLRRVKTKGSASDVATMLSEQAEIDRAVFSNSLACIRFIAWLIPVLGFIGTVLGISLAISGFPQLFQSASQDIGDQLGPITTNLGVAFETTLLALIKTAIVMLVTFAVQKRGNELLNTFDEFCLDNLLSKVRGGGTPEEDLPESYRHLVQILSQHVEVMEEKFEKAIERVSSKIVEEESRRWESFTKAFREITNEHQETIHKTCEAIMEKSEGLAQQLREFTPAFLNSIDDMLEKLYGVESQRVQQVAIALTDAGEQAKVGLVQAGEVNTEALRQASDKLSKGLESIEELIRSSKELQAMQETLHSNLAALTQTDEMRKTIKSMSDCTERLIPVLRELEKRRRMQVRIVEEIQEESSSEPDGQE